ncbi:hypothetical protein QRQ56_25790 [Bradyrhizobium sp. U531]|uniref:hypothetical protein n=1 Tax=Bradyrhizobium sp. U531 TaxID=3053458 RepID=UPI003F4378FD
MDVLFLDVAQVNLPTFFDGLSILEASDIADAAIDINFGKNSKIDQKVYLVQGAGFKGHVIAGNLAWHEDQGAHYDSSFFSKAFTPLSI